MKTLGYCRWTLFVRLAHPHKHVEAISSRPLLLHSVTTHMRHTGQTRLTIHQPARQAGVDTSHAGTCSREIQCGVSATCSP